MKFKVLFRCPLCGKLWLTELLFDKVIDIVPQWCNGPYGQNSHVPNIYDIEWIEAVTFGLRKAL